MWRAEQPWGQFKLGYWYKDSINVDWTSSSDAPVGYPYHSGCVLGVNDTAKVLVLFDNRTPDNYSLSGKSPEDWFYPVLYDPYVDVFKSPPLADTSAFEYRFEGWINTVNKKIISKPDSIYALANLQRGQGERYGMVYSIWDVGPGTYRVILEPTASKPTDIKLSLTNGNNYFIMAKGQSLEDTLNAYAKIATSALARDQYTLFDSYVDSVFNKNSQSVLGWALKYMKYERQADTTNAITALDSLLNNLEYSLDPLIPDSSDRTDIHDAWLKQWEELARHYRYRLTHPEIRYRYFDP